MTAAANLVTSYPNIAWEELSIAIIGPDDTRRSEAASVLAEYRGLDVHEYTRYPDGLRELPQILDQQHDVLIVDLDSDPETALRLVEGICVGSKGTVMVYSAQVDPDLMVRCMQAGAREFLTVPFRAGMVEEALVRASVRQPKTVTRTVRSGKLMVFMGAKGGVGVTSIACNFAVALAQEPQQKTVLIDLDLPLGDAALNLGIVPEFSTIDALKASDRLDGSFLSKLLVKHSSRLWVLAAPGRFSQFDISSESIEKLLAVARSEFDNVVIDAGSRLDPLGTAWHRDASAIYLVTQSGIPELRNANRLIQQVFSEDGAKLQIVLNRYQSKTLGISEKHITEALTRPVQWKIPNNHALVRKMQINASPLVLEENPIANIIRTMANAANGNGKSMTEAASEKKKRSLFFFL